MREIKFRAWDKKFGISSGRELRWLIENNSDFDEYAIYMQYTGLKDKNGVEIYEGDIVAMWYPRLVKNDDSYYFKVYFEDAHFRLWRTKQDNQAMPKRSKYRDMEVIGNIYENPELIK